MTKSIIKELEGKEKEIFDEVWDLVPESDDWERLQVEEDLVKRAIYEAIRQAELLFQKAREELRKKRVCDSRVGLHICEEHSEDCYFTVEWEDIERVLGIEDDRKNL